MLDQHFYVYIMASTFKRLYTGVTNDLEARIAQHKQATNPNSFTGRYRIDRLVYFEPFRYIASAIAREKQIKGWLRIKKVNLIVETNPTWQDLSEDWGKPTTPFHASTLKPPTTF